MKSAVTVILLGSIAYTESFSNPSTISRPVTSRTASTTLAALAIDSAQEGSWKAYLDDEKTGLVFYYNHKTGESRWEPPSSSFPQVQLTDFLDERMQNMREAYLGTVKRDRWGPLHDIGNLLVKKESSSSVEATSEIESSSSADAAHAFASPFPYKNILKLASNDSVTDVKKETENELSQEVHKVDIIPTAFKTENLFAVNVMDKIPNPFKKLQDDAPAPAMNKEINGGERPSPPKRESKFDLAQRIESTKAGAVGFATGATVLLPFNLLHTLMSESVDKTSQFAFSTSVGAIEAALFSIVYRYCVRDGEESNAQLGQGVAGAFAITRALSLAGGNGDTIDFNMVQQIILSGVESLVLFGAVKFAMDMLAEKGFVKRME